jgi:hypothetical protein
VQFVGRSLPDENEVSLSAPARGRGVSQNMIVNTSFTLYPKKKKGHNITEASKGHHDLHCRNIILVYIGSLMNLLTSNISIYSLNPFVPPFF